MFYYLFWGFSSIDSSAAIRKLNLKCLEIISNVVRKLLLMMKQWEQHGSGSMEGNDNIAEVWGGRCTYGVPGNKRDGTQWFTPSRVRQQWSIKREANEVLCFVFRQCDTLATDRPTLLIGLVSFHGDSPFARFLFAQPSTATSNSAAAAAERSAFV